MQTDYKFIRFEHVRDKHWIIRNRSDDILGSIEWYSKWKKYVFEATTGIIFDGKCLTDILDFINQLEKEK